MFYLKQRLFAVTIILTSLGLLLVNWDEALRNRSYYLKIAIFAPVGIVGGFFCFFFPQLAGKPKNTRERIITLSVFAIGFAIGLCNWYLIDPRSFPF